MQVRPLNVYDVMFNGMTEKGSWNGIDPQFLSSGSNRMFGNRYVGMQELTNLQVAGMLACDQTAWILNWYARTNIPACAALDEWAHSATITLQVGYHNSMQLSLFDLLRRKEGVITPLEVVEAYKAENEESVRQSVGRRALQAYEAAYGRKRGMFDLHRVDREAWLAVGAEMWKLFEGPRIVVVPVRQNFSVLVDGSAAALRALRETVIELGEGEDGGQTAIVPGARIWIHLEGVSFREGFE